MKHLLSISAHSSSLYHLRAKSQSNVRQVTYADGKVEQDNRYYPYGMMMGESSDILATTRGNSVTNPNPYLYGSKEYLTTGSANLLDFTARTYDPSLPLFQTQDPKSGDYTSFLPYLYCGADPINNVDPTGTIVRALNEESIENICYTLTDREAQYIRFIDGVLDNDLINMSSSGSENMMALKALSNSDVSYTTCSEYESDGKIISFEERGLAGITLMPKARIDPSPDDNVYILTYNGLTKEHQVTNTAHEGYGHAYFYELRRQGFDVNPSHTQTYIGAEMMFDAELGIEVPVFNYVDINEKLKDRISTVEKQASYNYKSRSR